MPASGALVHQIDHAADIGGLTEWTAVIASISEASAFVADFRDCTSADGLRAALHEFAQKLGFRAARYIHLGHGPISSFEVEPPPVRFLSTLREEVDPWRAGDPAAPRIKDSFLPFAWSSRDDTALPDVQRAWLSVERIKEIEAGLVIPIQDYVSGPAYLSLLCQSEAVAVSIADLHMHGLIFAGIDVHLCAKAILPSLRVQPPALTDRELNCLRHMAAGATLEACAASLGIAKRTVEFHCGKVVSKLDAANRIHAVAIAVSFGLIQL